MIRTLLKPLSFLPAILLMYMIFSFSAQDGNVSSSVSYQASEAIVKTADFVFDLQLEPWQIDNYAVRINGPTRKLAHMTEYFLLAIAVSFPLYVYGLRGILLVIFAGIICVGFAAGDEYHQSFVAGRAPSVKDVGIDSVGVLIGIIVVRIIGFAGRNTIFRPRPSHQERSELAALRREKERLEDQLKEERDRQAYYARKAKKADTSPAKHTASSKRYDDDLQHTRIYPGAAALAKDAQVGRDQERYDDRYDEDDRRYRYDDEYDDEPYDDRYDDYEDDRYDDRRYDDRYDERDDRRYSDEYDDRYDDDDYYYDDDDYEDEESASSDELSEDMPLSRLLHRKKRDY